MDRPQALAFASAASGVLSFSTLAFVGRADTLAHLADTVTWILILGAIVCALLAVEGLGKRRQLRMLIVVGLGAAALRALIAFAGMLPAP